MKIKFLITFWCLFLIGLHLQGRAFVVTTTQDGTDIKTLRGAINAANALGGNNTIILRPGIYQLGGYTALDITTGNLTIIGQGKTIIDASGLLGWGDLDNPVFHISSSVRATFENLKITGGAGYSGGGVSNLGQLRLDNCDISGNASEALGGGGINNSGKLIMFNCRVSNNSGGLDLGFSRDGGGIYNTGNLAINNCVISDNSTQSGVNGDYFFISSVFSRLIMSPGFSDKTAAAAEVFTIRVIWLLTILSS